MSVRPESTLSSIKRERERLDCTFYFLAAISLLLVAMTFPFSLFFCINVVSQYERAVIFRLGRVLSGRAKGPGIFFVYPFLDSVKKVDLRTVSRDIPSQEILTRDSVSATVDAVVYYRIENSTASVVSVENVALSTFLLAQTMLRNVLGMRTLAEMLSARERASVVS